MIPWLWLTLIQNWAVGRAGTAFERSGAGEPLPPPEQVAEGHRLMIGDGRR